MYILTVLADKSVDEVTATKVPRVAGGGEDEGELQANSATLKSGMSTYNTRLFIA